MLHNCIRPGCEQTYEDDDVEAYYCATCLKTKKQLAAEIDRKLQGSVSARAEPSFEEKVAGMKKLNGISFINL